MSHPGKKGTDPTTLTILESTSSFFCGQRCCFLVSRASTKSTNEQICVKLVVLNASNVLLSLGESAPTTSVVEAFSSLDHGYSVSGSAGSHDPS
jgi:hypothetical protein